MQRVTTMTNAPPPRLSRAKTPATQPRGVVARSAAAVAKLLRLLLVSLLVSVLAEWAGMHFWWPELGSDHSRQMVEVESRFLDEHQPSLWVASVPAITAGDVLSRLSERIKHSELLAPAFHWCQRTRARAASSVHWWKLRRASGPYLRAAGNVLQLYGVRLTVLSMAAPLFLMLMLLGLVDGLVQRDLRRWGGGRESAYVYHYAKRSNGFFLGLGAIVYLAMPVSLPPSWVLVPFAVACATTIGVTASRFKKYL